MNRIFNIQIFLLFSTFFLNAFADDQLLELSVEDLLNVEVTSVAKKVQSLNDSAAAIFVISHDDIKRSGVTSIPEALRMAPGIDVSRIDANKWAVSSRGFNGRFSNKLLVLIDGRSIYTRAFAGVYWETRDVMLEDVDRIEVIRGPGATMWGANAVNGVINIITKHTSKTLGGLLAVGGGTEEKGFAALRYGTELGEDSTARIYVKGFKRDDATFLDGQAASDDWDNIQGGFRIDSQLTLRDQVTLQGDMFHSNLNQRVKFNDTQFPYFNIINDGISSFGGNISGKYQHVISPTSNFIIRAYNDFYRREDVLYRDERNTFDIDAQHQFSLFDWNDVIWGVSYRYSYNHILGGEGSTMIPENRFDDLVSGFIQDEITIMDDELWLTIGSKFEHNDYSGFEYQPTARIMWAPHHQHRFWGAVSRAVRTPSRWESDASYIIGVLPPQQVFQTVTPPIAIWLTGDKEFTSEEVITFEIGYRTTMFKDLSVDLTAFYNEYDRLRSATFGPLTFQNDYLIQNLIVANDHDGTTYGFEAALVWQILEWIRCDANYSFLQTDLDSEAFNQIGASPEQRFSIRGSLTPVDSLDLDLWLRYVDTNFAFHDLQIEPIKDYFTLDLRLAWRPVKDIEFSLVGQNLLAEKHIEYQQETLTQPTAIDRGMYGKLVWQF